MTHPRVGSRLHACLRGFPAAALELSADGYVVDSNGRLESLLGRDVVGRRFAELLDGTSRPKWERLLASRDEVPGSGLWELVMEGRGTLELRTFAAIWGKDGTEATLWLVEYSRDLRLEPLYEELAAANTELVNAQRELAKERARLTRVLAQEAEARAAAERATARLRALHAISSSVRATHTQEETAGRLLAGLRDALEVNTATVLLLDAAGRDLEVFASVGLEVEVRERVRVAVGHGFAGRIAATRRSAVVHDTAEGDIVRPHLRAAARSVAGAPLLVGDRLIGVLHVGSAEPRQFAAEDVQLLELIARDVAAAIERAQLLEAERAARAEAERAVRLRDEVLAVVAHDLRNPINRISATASLLGEESLDVDSKRRLLGVLRRGADVMNRLVRDLLDVASIEAGRLAVERQPMDTASLIVDVCEMFRVTAAERGVRLDREVADGLPLVVADHGRMLQVLGNLIDNALRLTPSGGRIAVGAERIGDAVQLSVSDTGPGIAPEELPHLFDRFWQGARARRGSAGLGLAIAKGIVDAHQGRLWAESRLGEGSTFFIVVPAAGEGTPHQGAPGAP